MAISKDDFEEMTIEFVRMARTSESECYTLFSDDPEAGAELRGSGSFSRVGTVVIQYAQFPLSRPYANGILILETEWDWEAISDLISVIDDRVVASLAIRSRKVTFDVNVYVAERLHSYIDPPGPDDEDKGLYGIHEQMRETQELIELIPETIDDVIAEQYNEIEEIIEAQDLNEEEKRRRVRDKLRVGLEMGLPTIMFERSSE